MSASGRSSKLIDAEEGARRLARVILSDIELYNRERIRAGASLQAEIEEGQKLFRSRVVPELFPLFATVLADKKFRADPAARPPAAAVTPAPVAATAASAAVTPAPVAVMPAPVTPAPVA